MFLSQSGTSSGPAVRRAGEKSDYKFTATKNSAQRSGDRILVGSPWPDYMVAAIQETSRCSWNPGQKKEQVCRRTRFWLVVATVQTSGSSLTFPFFNDPKCKQDKFVVEKISRTSIAVKIARPNYQSRGGAGVGGATHSCFSDLIGPDT